MKKRTMASLGLGLAGIATAGALAYQSHSFESKITVGGYEYIMRNHGSAGEDRVGVKPAEDKKQTITYDQAKTYFRAQENFAYGGLGALGLTGLGLAGISYLGRRKDRDDLERDMAKSHVS